ncbi:hypothetical protein OGATHE_006018 [Ogataea polymorpha]|uniref:Uncharacterized protein n=1 Tax=Ogataea polymorpha TaxID=460523 RepID=A0A9P8SYT0_9ASCO|nr:hypothetical protein OGATHE_006018 [Ogataea polymorpha]
MVRRGKILMISPVDVGLSTGLPVIQSSRKRGNLFFNFSRASSLVMLLFDNAKFCKSGKEAAISMRSLELFPKLLLDRFNESILYCSWRAIFSIAKKNLDAV